jgi:perosamine synthetase
MKVVKMLKRHLPNLPSYFRHRTTNATSEGFNSVLQSLKYAARGFRSFKNYRTRILYGCGSSTQTAATLLLKYGKTQRSTGIVYWRRRYPQPVLLLRFTEKLEEALCAMFGAKHTIALNSGTAALHLACAALDMRPGDEVITNDNSCAATGFALLCIGASPVFVDVDPRTWCLNPEAIRAAVTPRSRAIMACHWAAMDEILEIAEQHGLAVIEDAAQTLGSEYRGGKVGTLGQISCFSLQGAKVAVAGMGGVAVTNHDDMAEKMRILASYGRTDSVVQYWSDYVGFNYTMPNLPAALALAQVEGLDELIAKKRQIFEWYEPHLGDCDKFELIREAPGTGSTYCYTCALLSPLAMMAREPLPEALRKDNIDSCPAQPRMSGFPMFERRFENPHGALVETNGIILSSAFNLEEEDIGRVSQRIRELVEGRAHNGSRWVTAA